MTRRRKVIRHESFILNRNPGMVPSQAPIFMRGRRNPGKMRRFPLLVWVFPPKPVSAAVVRGAYWVQARQEQKQFCLSGFSGPKFFEKGSHWPLLCFLRGRRNPGKMRRFREEGPVTPSGFAGSIHEEHKPSRLGPRIQIL